MARGYFVPPTVFTDVRDDMRIAQEEMFGPVISAIPFDDIEDVIQRANRTPFGLGSGVWTHDVGKAHKLARSLRAGERAHEGPLSQDAALTFIGCIHTPWSSRLEAPRQGRADGPLCRIEVFPPWAPALQGLERFERIEVLYWLHLSRRDLVLQSPASDSQVHGTFALRSPVRPNPIGTAIAQLVRIEGAMIVVRGLDCLDGTPLLDIKPDRTLFKPIAPPQPGDFETA